MIKGFTGASIPETWERKYKLLKKSAGNNNLIENQMRFLALGSKNYMHAGSHQGARYAAMYYSFFSICQLNGIDPHTWFTDVYIRIDDHPINHLKALLPLKENGF